MIGLLIIFLNPLKKKKKKDHYKPKKIEGVLDDNNKYNSNDSNQNIN